MNVIKEPGQNLPTTKDEKFYDDAVNYWSKIPPTVEGMLGGFGFISGTDVASSKLFLDKLFRMKPSPGRARALDCGAGIGRITKNLLIKIFDKVDLVEQNPKFLKAAASYIGNSEKIGDFFEFGLQDFIPESSHYDVIWCQWVLGHLQDDHFIDFFKRCISGLKENGVIIVKENVTSSGNIEVDVEDSSVTRPLVVLHELFKKAGLDCFRETTQQNFPKRIYAVKMFALRATNPDNVIPATIPMLTKLKL